MSAYEERAMVIAAFAKLVQKQNVTVGMGRDEDTEDGYQNVIYIDLPTGQVSWHIADNQLFLFEWAPPYEGTWDGHDTVEKYRRLLTYSSE